MPHYTYVTPTFIAEMVHLITYVQLTGKVKVTGYTALAYSYQVGFCKALQL